MRQFIQSPWIRSVLCGFQPCSISRPAAWSPAPGRPFEKGRGNTGSAPSCPAVRVRPDRATDDASARASSAQRNVDGQARRRIIGGGGLVVDRRGIHDRRSRGVVHRRRVVDPCRRGIIAPVMLPLSFSVVMRQGACRGGKNGKAGDRGGGCRPPHRSLLDHLVTHCCLLLRSWSQRGRRQKVRVEAVTALGNFASASRQLPPYFVTAGATTRQSMQDVSPDRRARWRTIR